MDHSLYGYLSRRTNEELENLILVYEPLQEEALYKHVLDLINQVLEERSADRQC